MRIAIFTEEDYTFMFPEWLRLVKMLHARGDDVVGFYVFPSRLGKSTGVEIHKYYIRTFGLYIFFRLGIFAVLQRMRQVVSGLFTHTPITYRQLASSLHLEVRYGRNPNDTEAVGWVRDKKIDVIFISLGYIIKQPLIDAVRVAILNKHSALLPAYRGLFPVFWTLLDGALPVAATVHRVNAGIDTGDVLYQKLYDTCGAKTVLEYYQTIFHDLANTVVKSLDILQGRLAPIIISMGQKESYGSLPTREDYVRFRQLGRRFV